MRIVFTTWGEYATPPRFSVTLFLMSQIQDATHSVNRFVNEYGVWLIGALFGINLWFAQRIVTSVDESKVAVTVLQTQMRTFEGASDGYLSMRVELAKLQTQVELLTEQVVRITARKQ